MKLDLDIGDIILTGRFKNKAVEVKEFGTDEKGQPTINGRPILKFRIKKLIPENKKMNKARLQQIIKEEVSNVLREGKYKSNISQRWKNVKDIENDLVQYITDASDAGGPRLLKDIMRAISKARDVALDKSLHREGKINERAPKMKVYSWEKNFKEGLKNLDVAANMMKMKSPEGYRKIKKDLGKVQKALMTLHSQMKINSTEF